MLYLLYREGCVERVAGREHGVAGSLTRFADDYHLGHELLKLCREGVIGEPIASTMLS